VLQRTDVSSWTLAECTVPARPGQADAFLTMMLRPVLDGMADAAQLRGWYFERGPDRSIRLHVRDVDRGMLVARLTGLLWAADHVRPGAVGIFEYRQVCVKDAGGGGWSLRERAAACRCTQLALDIIAACPDRPNRVRTAFDLVARTAGVLRIHSAGGLARLVLPDGAPAPSRRFAGSEPMTSRSDLYRRRWSRPRGRPGAERDRLASLVRCLTEIAGADGTGAAGPVPTVEPTAALLRLLGNQLGLAGEDLRRIYGALLVSRLDPCGSRTPRPRYRYRPAGHRRR
jgi:hypothetical protein